MDAEGNRLNHDFHDETINTIVVLLTLRFKLHNELRSRCPPFFFDIGTSIRAVDTIGMRRRVSRPKIGQRLFTHFTLNCLPGKQTTCDCIRLRTVYAGYFVARSGSTQ